MNTWKDIKFFGFKLVPGHYNDVDPKNSVWIDDYYQGEIIAARSDGGCFFIRHRITKQDYEQSREPVVLIGEHFSQMLMQLMTYRDCDCTPTSNCQQHPAGV